MHERQILDRKYRIVRQLGQGGMGAVYEAVHTGTGRRVALKVIVTELANGADVITRFQREARASGAIDESQRLGGVVAGIEAQYRTHSDWPLTLRLGVGVVIGSMNDKRTGTFDDSKGAPFALGSSQNATGVFLEIAPEVRIGRKFGDHFSLDVGVQFSVLTALSRAKWDGTQTVPAGGDGPATSATESLTGGVVLALTPGVGARYEF